MKPTSVHSLLLLLLACGGSERRPSGLEDDGDAATASDAGHDAQLHTFDARASTDASDASNADPRAVCRADIDFVMAHQACGVTSECTIVGACSGGFGFYAVQTAFAAEAQRRSDQSPQACQSFDGPTFVASCEEGRCVTRPSGAGCGAPSPLLDAGREQCPFGQGSFQTRCLPDGSSTPLCARPCDGADDISCPAGEICALSQVARVASAQASGCANPIQVWLCRVAE